MQAQAETAQQQPSQQVKPSWIKRFAEGAKPWKSSTSFTIFIAVNILIIGIVLLVYIEEIGYVGAMFILLSLYVVPTFTTGIVSIFSQKGQDFLSQSADKSLKSTVSATKTAAQATMQAAKNAHAQHQANQQAKQQAQQQTQQQQAPAEAPKDHFSQREHRSKQCVTRSGSL